MVRKHDSSTRVLTFVLTVAFGLLSAVIAYATFKNGSFELRSKAAIEEIILKQWTFDKVTEGWEAKDFLSSTITGGMYKLTVNSMRDLSPRLLNTSVQTILKYPVNKFRIRLSAGSPQLKKIMPSPPQRAYPFTLKVSQKYQGKKVSEIEQQISAVADAKEHEYSFEFPKDSNLKKVDELQITFVGLGSQAGTFVSINDIAFIGMKKVRPTPTKFVTTPSISPTPVVCGTGLKDLSPRKSTTCQSGYYLGMTYTCWNGYTGYIDEGIVCNSYDFLKQKVTAICSGRTNCPTTSTSPVPSPIVSQYPSSIVSQYPSPIVSQYPTSTPITPIASSIEILSPNGGETLSVGQPVVIRWNSPMSVTNHLIYLRNDLDQISLIDGVNNVSGSGITYNWIVNSPIMNNTSKHVIRIESIDSAGTNWVDESNAFFTITQ